MVTTDWQLILVLQPEGDDAGVMVEALPTPCTDQDAQEQALEATEAITEGRALCVETAAGFVIVPADSVRYARVQRYADPGPEKPWSF